MMLAAAYWSLWTRVPAYLVGLIIFGALTLYSLYLLIEGKYNNNALKSDWRGIALFAFVWIAAPAYFMAWDEKRVIAAFAEWFIAHFFFYGMGIAAISSGGYIGYRLYKKTSRQWIGWLAGIVVGVMVATLIAGVATNIPGVDWRLEQISDESD
jgi:hypothetical protein